MKFDLNKRLQDALIRWNGVPDGEMRELFQSRDVLDILVDFADALREEIRRLEDLQSKVEFNQSVVKQGRDEEDPLLKDFEKVNNKLQNTKELINNELNKLSSQIHVIHKGKFGESNIIEREGHA